MAIRTVIDRQLDAYYSMPSKYTQFTEIHVRDCALDVMRVFNVVDRQRTRPANRQTRNKNSLWSIVSWLNCTSQNSTRMFTKFRMLIDSDITIGHNWAIAYDFCKRVETMFFLYTNNTYHRIVVLFWFQPSVTFPCDDVRWTGRELSQRKQ